MTDDTKRRRPPSAGRGRVKGEKNKRTLALEELRARALEKGETPLTFMLRLMRASRPAAGFSRDEWLKMRLDCARSVAPYLHPRLVTQQVEMSGPAGGPMQVQSGGVLLVRGTRSIEDWMQEYGGGEPVEDDDGRTGD